MVLDELRTPVVLAPMAGGPSTPELTAAVCEAGGLGFLATGYLGAERVAEEIAAVRRLSHRPFGLNVFIPNAPSEPGAYEPYARRLREWAGERGLPLGDPRWSDDDFDAKIELALAERPAVVSFTFGPPPRAVAERLRAAGTEVWVTVTSPAEAAAAAPAADALVVQGAEAGGHRASFEDRPDLPVFGVLALLQLIHSEQNLPLVAAGGIATGAALAAALATGAAAAQIGSAFMLCPEAGTSPAHRAALRAGRETALTRAFSGRLARGIRNEFMDEHDAGAPIAYPEVHYVTAPLRQSARERGDDSVLNLWAGEAHHLAVELPAAEVVARLAGDAGTASARAAERLGRAQA